MLARHEAGTLRNVLLPANFHVNPRNNAQPEQGRPRPQLQGADRPLPRGEIKHEAQQHEQRQVYVEDNVEYR